ncbi:MAG TPA: FkbM family methyltransferase [Burkholderiales bacterium]
MVEALKRFVRICEARVTPFRGSVQFGNRPLTLVRSLWWNSARQDHFDKEIPPYFDAIGPLRPRVILDIGAATGAFSIAGCVAFPEARVFAFEPSLRQRIVLARNVRANGFADRVAIEPFGLWKEEGTLSFRTHGDISTLEAVSGLPDGLVFGEQVRVKTLDGWFRHAGLSDVDLIKMDVEGAEIEILEGASATLAMTAPMLLVQAYHLRGGKRTFDRCESILEKLGYRCREAGANSGLLVAKKPQ